MLATAYRNALLGNDALSWFQAFALALVSAWAATLAAIALYLTKSALGINLMPGPSPFHDLLFWMLV